MKRDSGDLRPDPKFQAEREPRFDLAHAVRAALAASLLFTALAACGTASEKEEAKAHGGAASGGADSGNPEAGAGALASGGASGATAEDGAGAHAGAGGAAEACDCIPEVCDSTSDYAEVAFRLCEQGHGIVTTETLDCGTPITRLVALDYDVGWRVSFDESGALVGTTFGDALSGAMCQAGMVPEGPCEKLSECYVCGTNESWRDPSMVECP
jgi:hypothetical protein